MDLKGAEKEFESEEKMFFAKICESKYPKVAVGKLSEKEIKECINLREKIIPSKNLEEKVLEIESGSELEMFFKKVSESSYPKIVLTKLSEKELKSFVDVSCLEPRGGRQKVKSASRKGDEVSRNEKKKNRKNGLKKQSCKYCNIDFKSKVELKTHLKSQCKRKFKCSHCSYEGSNKRNLNSHMLRHRNTKLLKCSQCTFECNYKANIKRHLLIHGNGKLFKCSQCDYESNYKSCLKLHLLKHRNTKLFKCYACNYECNRKIYMKNHC
ncbi:UNVERIFIED_CONTAM: hypothetical protein RMT77_012733 [Armadillidium vulgare]